MSSHQYIIISDELATFIGYPHGVNVRRYTVSLEFRRYINFNNLQDPTNPHNSFILNPTIRQVLKLTDAITSLRYVDLDNYMKHHCIISKRQDIAPRNIEAPRVDGEDDVDILIHLVK